MSFVLPMLQLWDLAFVVLAQADIEPAALVPAQTVGLAPLVGLLLVHDDLPPRQAELSFPGLVADDPCRPSLSQL